MALDQSITSRVLSPGATNLLTAIKDHYKARGKIAAATNYQTQARKFFQWSEAQGYDISNLPASSVEQYLHECGHKDTTTYLMRTQLKACLREATAELGGNFYHLEYEVGVPQNVKEALRESDQRSKMLKQKEKEKQKKGGKKIVAIPQKFVSSDQFTSAVADKTQEAYMSPDTSMDTAMGSAPTPAQSPQTTTIPNNNGTGNVVVQVLPHGVGANGRPVAPAGPGGRAPAATAPASVAVAKSITINTVTFTGPYVKISRVADGTDPLTPPGTEVVVTQFPTAHIAAHGDVGAFLQNYVVKHMKLSPAVSQVQFVLYELNDRRQPTGRRDEIVVGVPLSSLDPYSQGSMMQNTAPMFGAPQQPVVVQLEQQAAPQATPIMSPATNRAEERLDKTTEFLLRKLESDASESQKRAAELEKRLLETRDAQTTFLLNQQMRQEQELRQKLEEQKREAMERVEREKDDDRRRQEREEFRRMMEIQAQNQRPAAHEPPPWMMAPPPPPPPEIPRVDASAEMAKAFAESQAKMMEAMMNGLAASRNVPLPPPPPPQKDVAEWMVPMMTQMAQMQQQQAQMQAQMSQQQQQMMMQMQAENMKMVVQMQQAQAQSAQQANERMLQFMMASNSKESPEVAVLREQLRQSQNQINALSQRGDEIENLADQIQKIQAVSEVLGTGGGGKGGGLTTLISELIQNADTIGKGVAAAMQGINAQKAAAAMAAAPVAQAMSPAALPAPMSPPSSALAQAPQPTAQTAGSTAQAPEQKEHVDPPADALAAIKSLTELGSRDDVEAVESRVQFFVEYLKALNLSNHPLFQRQLERLLKAFGQAEDVDDLYTMTKHLWIVVGEKADKPVARLTAEAITKYYAMIHKSLFGKARALNAPPIIGPQSAAQAPDTPEQTAGAEAQAAGSEEEGDDSEEEGEEEEDDSDDEFEESEE